MRSVAELPRIVWIGLVALPFMLSVALAWSWAATSRRHAFWLAFLSRLGLLVLLIGLALLPSGIFAIAVLNQPR